MGDESVNDESGELTPDSSFIIVLQFGVGDNCRMMSQESILLTHHSVRNTRKRHSSFIISLVAEQGDPQVERLGFDQFQLRGRHPVFEETLAAAHDNRVDQEAVLVNKVS